LILQKYPRASEHGGSGDANHETQTVKLDRCPVRIDKKLVPLIRACWKRGLKTVSSCEELQQGFAYIAFSDAAKAATFEAVPKADCQTTVFLPVKTASQLVRLARRRHVDFRQSSDSGWVYAKFP